MGSGSGRVLHQGGDGIFDLRIEGGTPRDEADPNQQRPSMDEGPGQFRGFACRAFLLAEDMDQRGDTVLPLEAHHEPGGMTQEFHRHGAGHHWSFASGLHDLGKVDGPLGMQSTVRYLTGDRIQWQDLPERYDVFDWGEGAVGVPAGHAALETELSRRFPAEARAIRRYLRHSLPAAARGLTAINIANSLPEGIRRLALPLVRRFAALALATTQSVLEARFRSPELRSILAF